MSSIKYVKSSEKYAKSFCKTLDVVAKEKKYLLLTKGFPEEVVLNFIENIVKNNCIQFFALKDNEVIGWCDIRPNNFEGFEHIGILGIGILPGYRHQGIGTTLLKMVINDVKNNKNIEKIELDVFKSNKNAIKLFEKHGFLKEGERIKSRKIDGVYDNIILMGKEI